MWYEQGKIPGFDDREKRPRPDIDALIGKTDNMTIIRSIMATWKVLGENAVIACSISGGSDSDVMLDLLYKLDWHNRIRYVWFDTGVEYDATKQHLDELEQKYGITIERIRAEKTIPQCVKEYGQPFLSKMVSRTLEELQAIPHDWKDRSYEEDLAMYGHQYVMRKWHNCYKFKMYNIDRNRYLRDFVIENPPWFKISAKCCDYAKKRPAHRFNTGALVDVHCIGVRKAEGGYEQITTNASQRMITA